MQARRFGAAMLAAAVLGTANVATQAETVGVAVDPGLPWIGFVNIFELPTVPGQDRGAYVGGEFLGFDIARVPAAFVGASLVAGPNGIIGGGPPGDPFWWQPDGSGGYRANKVLESSVYVDEAVSGIDLSGKTVSFSGRTLSQDLPAGYAAYAWVRDFEAGYQTLRGEAIVPLAAGETFKVKLETTADGFVQYGIAIVGLNADPAALGPTQTVTIAAVPEPASVAMMLAGALAVIGVARRRRLPAI